MKLADILTEQSRMIMERAGQGVFGEAREGAREDVGNKVLPDMVSPVAVSDAGSDVVSLGIRLSLTS